MASRRLAVMIRSERDRIRWKNKSFAELFIEGVQQMSFSLMLFSYILVSHSMHSDALSSKTKLVSK